MTTHSNDIKRAPEIGALTGVRIIPAALIVLFHYHEAHRYTGEFLYDAIVSKGYLWVEFFFVLSGFILYYAYAPRLAEKISGKAIANFLATRVSRIYPLQVATLL